METFLIQQTVRPPFKLEKVGPGNEITVSFMWPLGISMEGHALMVLENDLRKGLNQPVEVYHIRAQDANSHRRQVWTPIEQWQKRREEFRARIS